MAAAQNIYDDDVFFNKYLGYPRSTDDISGMHEWDSYAQFFPKSMKGFKVVDLGCGTARFSRYAVNNGAEYVLALDISKNMINKAKSLTNENESKHIEYKLEDLTNLTLEKKTFNLVFSCFTFHYLSDIDRPFKQIYDSLVSGGSFIFMVEHPIYTASIKQPSFIKVDQDNIAWPVANYQNEGQRITNWVTEGVLKYHRKIETYINLCIKLGFQINGISEWGPTKQQLIDLPHLINEDQRPEILTISCIKP